jgi:hypothetical protein
MNLNYEPSRWYGFAIHWLPPDAAQRLPGDSDGRQRGDSDGRQRGDSDRRQPGDSDRRQPGDSDGRQREGPGRALTPARLASASWELRRNVMAGTQDPAQV